MSEGLPLAALDLSDFRDVILFGLRIFLAVGSAFVGWLLLGPLFRMLFRMAFQRPMPPTAATISRVVGAVGVGVLMFWLFPLGIGGGGGSGGGDGPGTGPEAKDGKGKKDEKKQDGKEVKPVPPGETVRIEMVRSEDYKPESFRYYLIGGKEPSKTLDEVKGYLKEHKGKFKVMDVIIYSDSVNRDHEAVKELFNLREAPEFGNLRAYMPKEYWGRKKLAKG